MTIQINKVAPLNAITWFRRGWVLFKAHSGIWMQSVFFIFVCAMLFGQMGNVGILLFSFVQPFLTAGFYHMAFNANHGVPIEFKDLFNAFKDTKIRRVFIQLASISLIIGIALSPYSVQLQSAMTGGDPLSTETALLLSIVNLLYFMFFLYAVPIAYFFHEQNLILVLKTSFMACLNNLGPLFVFAVLSMGLCLLTVPTLLLGMIIVLPWMLIAAFLSFMDLIGSDLDVDMPDDDNEQDMTIIV